VERGPHVVDGIGNRNEQEGTREALEGPSSVGIISPPWALPS